ncbi:MAG: NTP transferase domain-containing protein [Anaerolineales bacterium]|nr:NTP transferase domain-containing protein [Anaerolineales bacterium]MCB9128999.1 NTP transferase domain-containing protein [Ardenticatenales bacterium]
MHVIIPVAGYGTRLRPHTYSKPKPLVQVAGNTVLGHILEQLKQTDVTEITFIVGYLGEQVQSYVSQHYPEFTVNYVEQVNRKGQAHAIWLARELVDEPVLIIFSDTISDADLATLPQIVHDGVIYARQVEDPRRFGVVVTDGENLIQRFVEKPEHFVSDQAVIGIYYLKDHAALFAAIERLMAEDIQTKGEYFLADALQLMIEAGKQLEARTVDVWEDCGTPDALLQTNRYMLEAGGAATPYENGEDVVIVPPVHIAPGVKISNAVVGPYVSLAEGCEVHNAILRDTIVDSEATIMDTMLSESLIGHGAVVRGRYRQLNVGDSSVVDFG